MNDYVSDCCGASAISNGDTDNMEIGICSECGEHCDFIDLNEE